jgi:hypothetical protein
MTAARVLATIGVACACAAQSPAPPLTGEQVLARAKAVFRSHARPPFVAYTLSRRDRHNDLPDFENSYTLKIWCRTADRSALTRRAWKGKAYGSLQNITVAFDEVVDPGPPTADIFERALYGPKPASEATPQPDESPLPVIGAVSVNTDYDYRVTGLRRDGTAWHLVLQPKRDPKRNRIDDLWVDATTFELVRMRVRDHLYFGFGGQSIDDEFDARFTLREGLPLLATIHGQTRYAQFETDYAYSDVTFPASLPDWYFDPKSYGAHTAEAPS